MPCDQFSDRWLYIPLSFILISIVFYLIDRLCTMFESIEISLAFMQFLGVFSEFEVGWKPYFEDILGVFNIFNLSLETARLPCAGFGYTAMWMVQVLGVPALYVASSLLIYFFQRLTLFLAVHRLPPTYTLLRLGWRPARSFNARAALDLYLPSALRYLNTYYLNGVQLTLEVFRCDATHGGLYKQASIACWASDDHWMLFGFNFVAVAIYLIGVPAM